MTEAVDEPDVCYYCNAPEDECTCEKCEMCEENIDAGDCECVECHVCDTKLIEEEAEYNEYSGMHHCSSCCPMCGGQGGLCDCCEFCELPSSSCECHSAFGWTDSPGWEKRGHVIRDVNNGDCFMRVWPELDLDIDPVQEAATFYLLEGISHGVPYLNGNGPFHTTTKEVARFTELFGEDYLRDAISLGRKGSTDQKLKSVALEAAAMLNERTLQIVDSFWAYVHIAVSGESRHHQAIGGRVLLGPRDHAWTGWRQVYDTVGTEAINDLVDLFHEFGDGSFGGKVWADAATILYNYEQGKLGPDEMTNKRMFLDRIFTMVHNNGSLLDKVHWQCYQDIHLDNMDKLLDAHAADEPNWNLLYTAANQPARQVMDAWYTACERLEGEDLPIRPSKATLKEKVCYSCRSIKGEGHYIGCCLIGNTSWTHQKWRDMMIWDIPNGANYHKMFDNEGNITLPEFDMKKSHIDVCIPAANDLVYTEKETAEMKDEITLPSEVPIGRGGHVYGNSMHFRWNIGTHYDVNESELGVYVTPCDVASYGEKDTKATVRSWMFHDNRGHGHKIKGGQTVNTVRMLKAFLTGKEYANVDS